MTWGASRLVFETEMFLTGEFAERVSPPRHEQPGWRWLNALAHGDLQRLYALCAPSSSDHGVAWSAGGDWTKARRLLAFEVLVSVDDDAQALANLQRTVLQPLERKLLTGAHVETADELVRLTRDALASMA